MPGQNHGDWLIEFYSSKHIAVPLKTLIDYIGNLTEVALENFLHYLLNF